MISLLAVLLPPGSRSPRLATEAPAPSYLLTAPLTCRVLELSLELSRVSLERDSLSRELFRTIRQKVALTQELEAWQVRGRGQMGGAYEGRSLCADPPLPPG